MQRVPIDIARRRASVAKRALALSAALTFALTVGLARASHPGAQAKGSQAKDSSASSTRSSRSSSAGGFGQPDIAPSQQSPDTSTSAS